MSGAAGVIPASRAGSATAYRRAGGGTAAGNSGSARASGERPLKLDANEGPLSLLESGGIAGGIAAVLPEALREYPDVAVLERMLCEEMGVDAERLVVTAGGDDALCRICQAVLEPGRTALATTPTFEMIPRYVRLAGATLRETAWMGGAFPVEEIEAGITPDTKAIFVVTPNNPTGGTARAQDLERLSRRAPGALLVVDLAYTEFADEDLTGAALALPNAVVVRTFSKAWGLAGLRVGYAVGGAEVISWLRAVGQPYAVAAPSAAIAAWARAHLSARVKGGIEQVRRERAELTGILRAGGNEVFDSQGNFVLLRSGRAADVAAALGARGIVTRLFTGREELVNCLRITCPGEPAAFDRLRGVLETFR